MVERVVVLGGGPAGATAAALLAREGARVILVEKQRFPRHHVGESLQPASLELLDRYFGLGPALAGAGFSKKYGAVYVWGETREPWRVLFDERLERDLPGLTPTTLEEGGYEHAWNVERSRFDALLLEEAAQRGVDVREEWEALHPLEEEGRIVGVRGRDGKSGREEELSAHLLLDASGQRCFLGRHLQLTREVVDLRSTATYAYVKGAGGFPGPLGRRVQWVVTIPEGWMWFIPLSQEWTSVGLVSDARERMSHSLFHQKVLEAGYPVSTASYQERKEGDSLYFAKDWSFTHQRLQGPGWMLLGDAACFVDPILSGGVDFAIRGGCAAALAALRILGEENGEAAAIQGEYEKQIGEDYRAYLRLARYWYGNNRSLEGLFWEAKTAVPGGGGSTPYRAFVYLTTGRYGADRHTRVFQEWQEKKMFRALGVDRGVLASQLKRLRNPERK